MERPGDHWVRGPAWKASARAENDSAPTERRRHMTMTTTEADPAEDVAPGAPPTLVEVGSAAPASAHAGGSVYTCPACRQAEGKEG